MPIVSILPSEPFPKLPLGLRLSLGLLGLMVTLPFLQPIHHAPIPSFYEEWLAMLLGILAIVAALASSLSKIAFPSFALIPGILFLAVLVQFMTRQITVPVFGLFYCGYLAWAVALACLGATLAEHLGRTRLFRALAIALLAGTLTSAMLAFAQRLEIHLPYQFAFPSINGGIYANIGQSNLLNTYLWIGIVSLIYLRDRSAVSSVMTVGGILVLGAAAGLTLSRTAYLHGGGLILLDLWLWRQSKLSKTGNTDSPKKPHWPYLLAGLSTVFVAGEISRIVPWSFSTQTTGFSRMHTSFVSGDARLGIWHDALSLIINRPWAGNGVGNFPWRMVEAAAAAPDGAMTFPGAENAHNLLLQIGADFGLPLLILVAFLGARWLIQLQAKAAGSPEKWAIGVLALLAIHSQLEYPLWDARYLGLCALLAGAIDRRPQFINTLRQRVLQISFLLAAVALLPLRLDYGTLDAVANAPIEGPVREDWQRRMSTVAALAKNSVLSAYAVTTLGNMLEPDRKLAAMQSSVCERTMVMWPDPGIITNCAVLRQLTGHDAEAHSLLSLTQHAFRDPKRQSTIRATLDLAAKNNPGMVNLGMPKK